MKRVMTAALVLSLLGGTSAFAQQPAARDDDSRREARQDRREDRGERRQDRREDRTEARQDRREDRVEAREDRTEARQDRREDRRAPTAAEVRARAQAQAQAQARAQARARAEAPVRTRADVQARARAQADARAREARRGNDRRDTSAWNRDDNRRVDQNRQWRRPGEGRQLRQRDNGRTWYSANNWRRSYHAPRRYRASAYHRPSGWYARTWVFGAYLPRAWYGNSYYLNWWSYGLPRPPIGTEWVRVGDDALLVDVWSGRVLSVYYDLFW